MRNRKSKPSNPKREGRFVFCFAGTSRASAREICEELHFTIDALGSGGTRAPFWRRTSAKVGGVMEAAESLIRQGFVPKQDVYFAFGGDEEVF